MEKVRIGVIGLGNMGAVHARYIAAGEIPGGELTAVCDVSAGRLGWAGRELGEKVALFDDADKMMSSGNVDAVIIATIHNTHPELAIKAFDKGLHVLIEKPAGVYTKQVAQMNSRAQNSGRVFAIMYNQRTNPVYLKLKDLVDSNELGEIKRTNWIITSWYRPRATWRGEGGGVLLNQDPHQLDIWQWICGMPKRVRAFCYCGKYHKIEVEDDVTAFVEYDNGATGVFVTSTGDAPGTNRFEISADKGKVVVENDTLTFYRLRVPEREFNARFKGGFGAPECWRCEVPVKGENLQHKGITANWVSAITKGTPLIAAGEEGIKGLSISNAMYLSSWTDSWIDLPIDEDLFFEEFSKKIKEGKTAE